MLVLGKTKEPVRVVLREAVKAAKGRRAEPEAYIVLAPISRAMDRRAHTLSRRMMGEFKDINEIDGNLLIDAGEFGSRELIRMGAIEWGGLGDAAGNVLALTPDRDTRMRTALDEDRPSGTIDLLLADDELVDRIDQQYIRPHALRRAEKNALSASPSGTGGAATPDSNIAGSPANRKARRAAAKSVRTASTRSRRKPPKASGRRSAAASGRCGAPG